ncbi:hypothetical protein RO3G_04098 [Rhizopus delemar RA 99-880]|uniref:RGS domain-containing protein n=1 Tax=Rhizopus delemar (strain RA 99-880 / ATCC MYA-4621 / FGSC 9543 / NRRL 43880) TaxID=246409 RepID=I1BT63_RHIO9|nr:hypothetical protein RO3G_04098 [Rhizopus delemar RA 99-880]|eukprot:EIE79393.1 hypothetical protein RO3G_04098 [Rhizopus delemar RA 99-880]
MSNIGENPIINNIDQTVSPIERKCDESNAGSPFILPSILLNHQTDESYPFDNAISITRTLDNLECPLKDQDVENTELFIKKTHNLLTIYWFPSQDIEQEGLKLLLHSAVPLGYFLYYLLTEYSSENLFFYLAVDNYQNYPFSSQKERRIIANKITKAYLTSSSELEVNLEEHVHKAVKKALEQQRSTSISSGNEFEAAKRHVFPLLNNSYYRFQTSPIWIMMESKCTQRDLRP